MLCREAGTAIAEMLVEQKISRRAAQVVRAHADRTCRRLIGSAFMSPNADWTTGAIDNKRRSTTVPTGDAIPGGADGGAQLSRRDRPWGRLRQPHDYRSDAAVWSMKSAELHRVLANGRDDGPAAQLCLATRALLRLIKAGNRHLNPIHSVPSLFDAAVVCQSSAA